MCSLPIFTSHQEYKILFSQMYLHVHNFRTASKEVGSCFPTFLHAVIYKAWITSSYYQHCRTALMTLWLQHSWGCAGTAGTRALLYCSCQDYILPIWRALPAMWFPSQKTLFTLFSLWTGHPLYCAAAQPPYRLPLPLGSLCNDNRSELQRGLENSGLRY